MCLITKNPIQVANEDITVYKTFEKHGDGICSPFMMTIYKPNELVTSTIEESDDWTTVDTFAAKHLPPTLSMMNRKNTLTPKGYKCYGRGIHSFNSLDRIKKYNPGYWELVYKCIIPAGSEYIIGEDGSVISTAIIVQSKVDKSECDGRKRWGEEE